MRSTLLKPSPGFTLIELLVVIAIIGILAAVVIGSLSSARDEGLSAKVKSELVILGKRASIEESQYFTFDTVCGSNGITQSAEVLYIIDSIENFSPEAVACNSTTDAYAVSAATASSSYWCVDSIGTSRSIPAQLSTTTPEYVCP